jgi:hypothetical protein
VLLSEINPERRNYIEACVTDAQQAFNNSHAATYVGVEGIATLASVCDQLFIPDVRDGVVHLSDAYSSEGIPVVALKPGEAVVLPVGTTMPTEQRLDKTMQVLDGTLLRDRATRIVQDALQLFEGGKSIVMSENASAYVANEIQPLETGDEIEPHVLWLQGRPCLLLRYCDDPSELIITPPTMGHELAHLVQKAAGIQIANSPGEEGLYEGILRWESEAYHVGSAIARGLAESGGYELTTQDENQIDIDAILMDDALSNPNASSPTPNAMLTLKIRGLLPPNFRY